MIDLILSVPKYLPLKRQRNFKTQTTESSEGKNIITMRYIAKTIILLNARENFVHTAQQWPNSNFLDHRAGGAIRGTSNATYYTVAQSWTSASNDDIRRRLCRNSEPLQCQVAPKSTYKLEIVSSKNTFEMQWKILKQISISISRL